MKTFEDICKMTQVEVKEYMSDYLRSKNYNVINEDGFLYAKGTVPVLLVAHMDTVHKKQCKEIVKENGKWSSPQGIGGDDRCGVFIIMNLVKELNCSVLLCEDEEIGGVGARKFIKTDYIKNLGVNYMIEFDRKGNNDAVFYSCGNKDFIDFVTDATGFKFAYGSFSDISVLMSPAKLSAVNLSSGYYNAHTEKEYVLYDEMMDTVEAASALIKTECEKPFEYVTRVYTTSNIYGGSYGGRYDVSNYPYNDYGYCGNIFGGSQHNDMSLYRTAKADKSIELEVIVSDIDGQEELLHVSANSKAECWMELFLDNPNLCFNDIADYSWC